MTNMSSTESLTDQYNMADEHKRGLMNLSSVAKFYFKPAEGEHIETTVKIESEKAAAICGTVQDRGYAPVEGGLVLLFKSGQDKRFITRQFTDEEGQFSFDEEENACTYKSLKKQCKDS